MSFQPFSDADDSTFVRVGRWVRTMENAHLIEQHDTDARAVSFADLGTKFYKQSFYVDPSDRAVDRSRE